MWLRQLGLMAALLGALLAPGGHQVSAASDSPQQRVSCALAALDLRSKVGQLFMVGIDGTRPSRHTANLLRSWRAGAIILFGQNIGSADDLRSLITGAQAAVSLPLLVATDQEGGSVTRIRVGLTPLPAPAYYGQLGSTARVYADTRLQGLALRALGINLDLAPVVDVRVTSASAIGDRSFGSDPKLVAQLVSAAIRGYQSAGIGATAKHFLGLGEVRENADLALPIVSASRASLEANEMLPMRAAVAANVAALMVTRVVIPALDPSRTPAYASATMLQNVIRGDLGYHGLIITDSLLSAAVLQGPGPTAAALAALAAGDDMLLLGSGGAVDEPLVTGAIDTVGEAVALGRIPTSRLNDAVGHVLALKARLGLLPRCGGLGH